MTSFSANRKSFFTGWICVFCLLAVAAHAQAPSPTPTPTAQDARVAPTDKTDKTDGVDLPEDTRLAAPAAAAQSGDSESSELSDAVLQTTSPPTLDHPAVKELGGHGTFFSDNIGWLHWGPVGLRSAQTYYTYATLDQQNSSANISATTIQPNIAYSQRLARSRLIWQYNPRFLIVNGGLSKQLLNQDSTLDILFAPGARFTWGVSNWLNYYGRDNTLNDRTLNRNSFSGAILNPFLNNGESTLLDSIALPMSYKTSARTTLSVAPFFSYGRTWESADPALPVPSAGSFTSYQSGARAQISHAFSPRQSLGAFFTYQRTIEKKTDTTTSYQSFGATWSRTFGASVGVVAEGGGSLSSSSLPGQEQWTGIGSLTITKSFRHSSLDATYGRNATFSGLVGSGYNDYAWANYNHQLNRKLSIEAGFGYLTGPSLGETARGKYVNGTIDYVLHSNVSWFFSYVRYMQGINGGQLTAGDQAQFQTGLQWNPARKPRL